MAIKFDKVLYIESGQRPEAGSYCRSKGIKNDRYMASVWSYCRELFHGQLYNLSIFFFSHDPHKGSCVANFMEKIEEKLNVQPRSEYGPTQRKTIMWIKPSRWWTVKAMRRSLYTILLRCGCKYSTSKDNFEEALYSDPYTMGTRYAVERFFAGNTIYTGKKRGWYKQFHDQTFGAIDKEKIDSLLIKPTE